MKPAGIDGSPRGLILFFRDPRLPGEHPCEKWLCCRFCCFLVFGENIYILYAPTSIPSEMWKLTCSRRRRTYFVPTTAPCWCTRGLETGRRGRGRLHERTASPPRRGCRGATPSAHGAWRNRRPSKASRHVHVVVQERFGVVVVMFTCAKLVCGGYLPIC